jgi:hypothetical protein
MQVAFVIAFIPIEVRVALVVLVVERRLLPFAVAEYQSQRVGAFVGTFGIVQRVRDNGGAGINRLMKK